MQYSASGQESSVGKIILAVVAFLLLALPLAATATVGELQNSLDQALGSNADPISLQWITPNVDSSHLELDPENNLIQRLVFQLNFSLEGHETFETGDLEIRMPRALFEDRNGNLIVGNVPNPLDGPAMIAPHMFIPLPAPGIPYNYRIDTATNEVVIYNYRTVSADDLHTNIQIEIHYLPSQSPNGFSNEFSATASFAPQHDRPPAQSNSLSFDLTTRVVPFDVATSPGAQGQAKLLQNSFAVWQPMWGTPIVNSEDFFFVQYSLHWRFDTRTTQPAVLRLIESPLDGGEVVAWGPLSNGVSNTPPTSFTRGTTASFNAEAARTWNYTVPAAPGANAAFTARNQSLIVAYPRTGASEQVVTNTAQLEITPADYVRDAVANPRIIQELEREYTFHTLEYEGDLFNHSKIMGFSPTTVWSPVLTILEAGYDTLVMPNNLESGAGNWPNHGFDAPIPRIYQTIIGSARGYEASLEATQPFTTTLIDDHVYLGTGATTSFGPTLELHQLEPEDYTFTQVRIHYLRELEAVQSSAGDFLGARRVPNAQRAPSGIRLYYKTSAASGWQHLSTWNPAADVGSAWFTLPNEGVSQVKAVHVDGTFAVEFTLAYRIRLNATPNVLDIIDGWDFVDVRNFSAMIVTDHTGAIVNTVDSYAGTAWRDFEDRDRETFGDLVMRASDFMRVGRVNYTSDMQKGLRGATTHDAENARIIIPYRIWGSARAQGNSFSAGHSVPFPPTVYAQLLTEQTSAVFYDLLPSGTLIDPSSIVARNALGATVDSVLVLTENWQNSGRTLVEIHVSAAEGTNFRQADASQNLMTVTTPLLSGTGFTVDFNVFYSWDSATLFGTSLRNIASYQSRNGAFQGPLIQSGGQPHSNSNNTATVLTEAERLFMQNFPNTDMLNQNERNTRSAGFNHTVLPVAAQHVGFSKTVRASTDTSYGMDTSVRPGSTYSYRLAYSLSPTGGQASNIVIYDVLENAHDGSNYWRGILESVDVSHPRMLNIQPVVYYSTVSGLNPQGNAAHANLANAAIWSTTAPTDRSTITAVA
ncbi:MAG: hypothetical protein FWC81_01955, partial [Coriobacteriia bacterium]|nr:hypothetical protein [Coriobacteriia bacterium]